MNYRLSASVPFEASVVADSFHMTTVEAAERIRALMAPDSVLITNVIAALSGRRSGVFQGIYAAFLKRIWAS